MGFPTSMRLGVTLGDIWKRSGVVVGLFPSTRARLPIELQFTSAGATAASSKWTSLLLPATTLGEVMSTCVLPLSTKRYYFRARHRAAGGFATTNGPFTSVISAKPTTLGPIVVASPVNAAANVEVPGADIWVSSGNKPRVGSQNTTSYVTAKLRIPYAALLPRTKNTFWNSSKGWIGTTGTTGTASSFFAPAPIPSGVTITKINLLTWGNGAPDTIGVKLLRLSNSSGAGVSISTAIMTGGHGWVNTTLGTTELVTSTKSYVIEVSMAGNNKFAWYDITYRRPDYAKVY